jgi:type IV secretory pathway VirB10-like protein
MSGSLEVPAPPRPKRLNRLALVAVLVLLGVAVGAVFSTLAPAGRKRPGEAPASEGGPARPGFLERAPAGAPPAGRPAPAERAVPAADPSYWQEALRRARPPAGTASWEVPEAGGEPGGAPPPGLAANGELARTPPPSAREEAYRRALLAPVTPTAPGRGGAAAVAAGDGAGDGAEGAGERIARQLGLPAPLAPGAPPAVAAALPPAGATTGQLPEGAVPAPAPPAGAAVSPARDHQGFLRGAETLAPAELRVRRDRAGAGVWLEAGTLIPAALVTAVDSDVAGPLVAQVTQDVFDREQREVVIPRGSRLIGAYDSQVALGERRLLVAWSRLIFPDGSGMSFPGLPAATRAGEAGLAGAVDNHLARVFGSAVLLSILSAGVQLSQPQESATFGAAASTRQVAAAAVGQQLSSVAIELLRREMSVPPTIRIAAGTRFLVFLRGDVRGEAPGQE